MEASVFLPTPCGGGSAGLRVLSSGDGRFPWDVGGPHECCRPGGSPAAPQQGKAGPPPHRAVEPGAQPLPAALNLLTLPAAPAFLFAALYLTEPSFCPHDVPEVPDSSRSFW